jgi:hypothetical protein
LDQYYCDAELSGVTLDASGVYGKADAYGSVYHAYINGNADISYVTIDHSEVTGATLSNVSLYSTNATTELMKGYYRLQHVTFGENVVVEAGSRYSINGNITFKDTIVNKGVIHITNVVAEIGQIDYTFHVADNGKSTYDYRFIRMEDGGRFDILGYNTFKTRQVEINGINLATGLATGIGAEFVDNKDGSFTLSVGKILAYDKDGNDLDVMYANGPTVASAQLLPTFALDYDNIASQAKVSADNVASTSEIKYLTDGLIPITTGVNAGFMNTYVKSTEFTDETTITLTFDDYKTVKGIMIHNSEWIESAFHEIDRIEFTYREDGKDKVKYIEHLAFDWKANSNQGFSMSPAGAAIAEFNEIEVKEIRITVKPATAEQVSLHDGTLEAPLAIGEIVVLGKK